MEIKGKIEKVMEVNQVTDNFKKRDFVLLVQDGNYPQYIKFECHQNKVSVLDHCREGDEVNVKFNLRGRPYDKNGTTLYFNTLVAWFIEKEEQAQATTPQPHTLANVAPPVLVVSNDVESNELPF